MNSIYTLIALSFLLHIKAQSTTPKAEPSENSLVWKVEGKDMNRPSYLFGTMHLVCSDSYNLPKAMDEILPKVEKIYLEIDMDAVDLMADTQKAIMSSEKISENVSKEDSIFIDDFLKSKVGTGLALMDHMKPFVVYSLLYQGGLDCPMTSVEAELIKKNNSQLEILGLETIEEQMSIANRVIRYDNLAQYIKEYQDDQLQEMIDLYINADIAGLELMVFTNMPKESDLYQNLLLIRNNNWMNRIPEIVKEHPSLFAVGTAHLLGEDGIIAQLKKQGYRVSPVH